MVNGRRLIENNSPLYNRSERRSFKGIPKNVGKVCLVSIEESVSTVAEAMSEGWSGVIGTVGL